MTKRCSIIALALTLLVLAGCATIPQGPRVMVLPPEGKPLDQFQAEDAECRDWAAMRIGIQPQETANQHAVAGTAIGAGIGAAIGSASGHAGGGAAIGAAAGLLAGASEGRYYGWEAQRRYDISYMQCMYAKGNQVPGRSTRPVRMRRYPPPPPPPDLESEPPVEYSPEYAPPPR